MGGYRFAVAGAQLVARGSGALWWPDRRLLVVADLHLGKSARMARRGGALLPPYEGVATLERLAAELIALDPAQVVCLGDSFDDPAAADLPEPEAATLAGLRAGRLWVWVAGNHDPDPLPSALAGTRTGALHLDPLVFRHCAEPDARAEISAHYHPKALLAARGQRISRPCFLIDTTRVILPAFGAYTGGLGCTDPVFTQLMGPTARAVLTGLQALPIPMPRHTGPVNPRATTAG